ncbi:protein boule-like [Fundulus diaphanus]
METQKALALGHPSPNDCSCSSSDVLTQENPLESATHVLPIPGTVVPNRIFVGGIDNRVNESDLRQVFSQHGAVKDVKIVLDRSGISKRYGFVTFETQDDALRILRNNNGFYVKEKKLCVGQAVRKHHAPGQAKNAHTANPRPAVPHHMSRGTFYMTTSTGHPYTFHKGAAYFHCPIMNPLAHHWSPHPQLMPPQSHQPVLPQQPPVYHHCQLDVPSQQQWSTGQVCDADHPSASVQAASSFSSAIYAQQPEYVYQPVDGGSYPPLGPAVEGCMPEFLPSTAAHFYPVVTPVALPHDPMENQLFPPPRLHQKP